MKHTALLITLALSCGTSLAAPLSRDDFVAASANSLGYFQVRVGDSLQYPTQGPQPELVAGLNKNNTTQNAQYDWPEHWMPSTLSVSWTAATGSATLRMTSSDPNSRPVTAALTLDALAGADTLMLGAWADKYTFYVGDTTLNGRWVDASLSPNAFSPAAMFHGRTVDGIDWTRDFEFKGSMSFSGGTQFGDDNRVEVAFVRTALAVPEPGTVALVMAGLAGLAWQSRRRASNA